VERLVGSAAVVGALIGLVAVLVDRLATPAPAAAPGNFGWYAYSPLPATGQPWVAGVSSWWPGALVALLAAAALSALVAWLAARRGWLRRDR